MESKIRRPIKTRIFCFLNSFILDPSKKNKAIEARTTAIMTIDILGMIIIIYNLQLYNNTQFKLEMNQELQQKIKQYREKKNIKKSFNDTIQQKKKKLRELQMDEIQQNESKASSVQSKNPNIPQKDGVYLGFESNNEKRAKLTANLNCKLGNAADSFMDFKHRRYIQITKQLMEAKSKLTEISHQCQEMKTEVFFQERKIEEMRNYYKRQNQQQEAIINKKIDKYQEEKKEKIKMYEDRIARNLEHIENLLKEKEQQNQRKQKFIQRKKKFQQSKKKIKQKYDQQLQKLKQKWAQQEQVKRKQWQQSERQKSQAGTLRVLQPRIQEIVQNSRDQVAKIRQKYEAKMQQFRRAADQQFEGKVKIFKQLQASQLQQQRNSIMQQNAKKLREQAEILERQFEEQRIKAKQDYNKQIQVLENRRKVQSEQYIRKNRYFYMQNSQQLKKIKDQYQKKIHELDGVLMKQVDERQKILSQSNRQKLQKFRESQRLKLKKRMQQYDKSTKQKIEHKIESVSSEIAIQNAAYETKIAKQFTVKEKQLKQNTQIENRQIKKSIVAIQNKIEALRKNKEKVRGERDDWETNYLEEKQEGEMLAKKLYQLNKQLEELKISESSVQGRKQERRQQVQNMWDRQIANIKQTLNAVEQEIVATTQVMKQREQQAVKETQQAIKQIQKHSGKIITQKQLQQQRLLLEIERQQKEAEGLRKIIVEQEEMIKRYGIK